MQTESFVVLVHGKDRADWALGTDDSVGLLIDGTGVQAIEPGRLSYKASGVFVIVADQGRAQSPDGEEAFGEAIASLKGPTVFVHFGGKNSSQFTRAEIQAAWTGLIDEDSVCASFASLGAAPLPFSKGAGAAATQWDVNLSECAKLVKENRTDWTRGRHDRLVRMLCIAAAAAEEYYEGLPQLRGWLSVCFPLYLDLRGIATAALGKREAYWAEAKASLQVSVARMGGAGRLRDCLLSIEFALRRNTDPSDSADAILDRCKQVPDLLIRLLSAGTSERVVVEGTDPLLALPDLYRIAEQHYQT